jgi:hypothetical protein
MATITMNQFKTNFRKIFTLLCMSTALLVTGNTKAKTLVLVLHHHWQNYM